MKMTMFRKYKRKKTKREEAGFTMIELVVVIVLSSFLGTFGLNILAQSLVAQKNMEVRKAHSDDAVLTLGKINRELGQARKPIHKSGSDEMGFEKVVWDGNLYVLYRQVLDEVLRLETASTGDNDNDYITVLTTISAVVARDVDTFDFQLNGDRGDVILRFNGEGDNRTTSVFIRNE